MGNKPYRRTPCRELKPRFLIVTEGETEENYFKAVKKIFRGLPIEIIPKRGKSSNPVAVLKTAKKEISASRDNQYTAAYAVVDKEALNADIKCLSSALEISRESISKKDIKCDVIISNPSFEYWILSHFVYTTKMYASSEHVISDLKSYIGDYKKAYDFASKVNDDNKDCLLKLLDNAIKNAKQCERFHGDKFNPLKSNPSTRTHIVLEHIKNSSKK